ncbi:hypothetical protein CMUS01_02970 [Colletotrichum musicola]|uniref:Uncharacterized protein n=1 Tax=Colletotrichum musicola TaxID=2175873 RepID=A0A8H6U6Z0_9PEZI|nr:hypothetical protein CMUS01_02970 [Colletotrichum musicola]
MSSSDQEPPPDESATPVAGNAALAQLPSQPVSLLCLYLNNRATTTTTRPRPPYRRSPSLNRKVRNIARGTARLTHSGLGATTFADAAEVLLTTAPVGPLDKSTAAIHHLTVGPRASVLTAAGSRTMAARLTIDWLTLVRRRSLRRACGLTREQIPTSLTGYTRVGMPSHDAVGSPTIPHDGGSRQSAAAMMIFCLPPTECDVTERKRTGAEFVSDQPLDMEHLNSAASRMYCYDDRDGSILPPMDRWNLNLSLPRQPRKPLCPPRPNRGSESTSHDAKTLSFISSSLPDFFQQAEDHTPHASWSRKSN